MTTMAFKPSRAFRRGMDLSMGSQKELRARARQIQAQNPVQESWTEVGIALRSSMETYKTTPKHTTPTKN